MFMLNDGAVGVEMGDVGRSDRDDVDQYPTPGLRCFSRRAAEDWTLRSSSRRV